MRLTRGKLEPMPAADFAAWLEAVREARGWSEAEVARRMGCAARSVGNWRDGGAPAHVALACAALLRGVGPWRPAKEDK